MECEKGGQDIDDKHKRKATVRYNEWMTVADTEYYLFSRLQYLINTTSVRADILAVHPSNVFFLFLHTIEFFIPCQWKVFTNHFGQDFVVGRIMRLELLHEMRKLRKG